MKMSKPGPTDLEYMVVTCTPASTEVVFLEHELDAIEEATAALKPRTSTYVGLVLAQGENLVRDRAGVITVALRMTPEQRRGLSEIGVRGLQAIELHLKARIVEYLDKLAQI